eukprot:GHVL01021567.1.p2 GENE.GHVL01021567.1~~GHVL01021567.1.p2  ORF type:complete len:296 (-),score=68.28 GHVL01021567.1:44-931(-)
MVKVDISFQDNVTPLLNSRMLRSFVNIHPRVAQLGRLVKYWAKKRRIALVYEGFISPFAWMIMVIHFLIHEYDLPCIIKKKNNKKKKKSLFCNYYSVNDYFIKIYDFSMPIFSNIYLHYTTSCLLLWSTNFQKNNKKMFKNIYEKLDNISITEIFYNFLLYFSHFNYVKNVIIINNEKDKIKLLLKKYKIDKKNIDYQSIYNILQEFIQEDNENDFFFKNSKYFENRLNEQNFKYFFRDLRDKNFYNLSVEDPWEPNKIKKPSEKGMEIICEELYRGILLMKNENSDVLFEERKY